MNTIDSLTSLALLGTSGREATCPLPELQERWEQIRQMSEDGEEAFYRLCSMSFAYLKAGSVPEGEVGEYPIALAPEETQPLLTRELSLVLKSLIENGLKHTLSYALRLVAEHGLVLSPEHIYLLLSTVLRRGGGYSVACRSYALRVSGARGAWILPYLEVEEDKPLELESWDTASLAVRLQLLRDVRATQPSEALALVGRTWREEPAASREALLKCFAVGLSLEDEDFLTELSTKDRSQRVKELARGLLECLPESALVRHCCDLLRGRLRYGRIRGWSYDPIPYSPELKALGIEEVSPRKGESDEHYILRQLAERVPMSFWTETLETDSLEEAAKRLADHPPFRPYFSVATQIAGFQDRDWAYWTLRASSRHEHLEELVGLLSSEQREHIDLSKYNTRYGLPEQWVGEDEEAWGPRFSRAFLQIAQACSIYSLPQATEQIGMRLDADLQPYLLTILQQAPQEGVQQMNPVKRQFFERLLLVMQTKRTFDKVFTNPK